MRAVKYGVTRDYVRGLQVVLPNGEIVEFGGKVVKNSSGYSLKDLIVGSEGTLGIVTKAVCCRCRSTRSVFWCRSRICRRPSGPCLP